MKSLGNITHPKDIVTKEYVDGKVSDTSTPYGTCSTAAGTVAKTVTVDSDSFVLATGACVRVKFSNSNTASNPTLNVNGTGAKAIKRYGTTAPSTSAASSWNAGSIIDLTYDGTYWVMHNFLNTTYSSMTVAEYEGGAGTTARTITPARLKAAILHWATEKDHAHSEYAPLSHSHDEYALADHTHSGYAASNHTHDYLPLAGGTLTGELLINTGTTQGSTKGIKWSPINSKNPYIGYALNQTDGTFILGSLVGTNYQDGLAIGGGSGNLLWKGTKVATTADITADTKNTAGSTDSSSKLFLIGATSQAANPQTYSHNTAYVDTNGHLYSNSKQVVNLSDTQALTNKTYNGYTLGAACEKGVDTTVTMNSEKLVTSGAVYKAINDATGFVRASASARGSASSLSLSASAVTKVTLDTWITQTDTAFTFSDGGIKCPYDGVVVISGSVYVPTGSSSVTGGCYIKKGTAEITSQYIDGVIGGVSAGSVSINVSAGDIIYLCARRSNAGTCAPNNTATHLDISYVQ